MVAQIKDSGIHFHPRKGSVLICDFRGHEIPEITKKRPVVVITPRLPHRDNLAMIIPLSTTPPKYDVDYVVKLRGYYGNDPERPQQYAKCDLISSVSFKRLDRVKIGYRKYITPVVSDDDLENIINGVRKALCI